MAGSVVSTPAAAFGLSDRQADEVGDFLRCKGYLLSGNLEAFADDPDCGKSPVKVNLKSLVGGVSSGREEHCYEGYSLFSEGNDYCYPDYK
jgi:hypothetical protein